MVVRIIREWENMDLQQKQDLGAQYLEARYINEEDKSSSSGSVHRTPSRTMKTQLMTTERTKPNHSGTKNMP